MKQLFAILVFLFVSPPLAARAHSFGVFGHAEAGCGSCHSPAVAPSPTTRVCLHIEPGESSDRYAVNVSVAPFVLPLSSSSDGPVAGFDLEVSGGSFQMASGNTSTQLATGPPAEATHTEAGSKKNNWDLIWIPPTSGDEVIFSLAGMAVDGNGESTSDFWNTYAVSLSLGSPAGDFCNPSIEWP